MNANASHSKFEAFLFTAMKDRMNKMNRMKFQISEFC